MVRPVHSDALQSVLHEVAEENAGFLYVQEPDVFERISTAYEERPTGLTHAETVTRDDTRAVLADLSEKSYATTVREGEVYFLNPFRLSSAESSAFTRLLERVFETRRYHTEASIVEQLRDEDISIAEDDISLFLQELKRRDLLEELGEATTYYRPGDSLSERCDLPDVSTVLASHGGRDGCLTATEIGEALDIGTIDDEIITDLCEEQSALFELEEEFLIDDSDCIERYVSHLTEMGLKREFEERFKSHNWVVPTETFEAILRDEASDLLSVIDHELDVFYDLRDVLLEELGATERTVQTDDARTDVYVMERRLSEFVREEAEAIVGDVSEKIDPENPPSMPVVLSEYAVFDTYSPKQTVDTYVTDRVRDTVCEQVHEDDDIPVWESL